MVHIGMVGMLGEGIMGVQGVPWGRKKVHIAPLLRGLVEMLLGRFAKMGTKMTASWMGELPSMLDDDCTLKYIC